MKKLSFVLCGVLLSGMLFTGCGCENKVVLSNGNDTTGANSKEVNGRIYKSSDGKVLRFYTNDNEDLLNYISYLKENNYEIISVCNSTYLTGDMCVYYYNK